MEPGGADEAQGADALLSLAALAEEADSPDTQSADEGMPFVSEILELIPMSDVSGTCKSLCFVANGISSCSVYLLPA